MSKSHLSLYAVLFAIVGLMAGWQGGSALANKHHTKRMENPSELAALLVEASTKKQGQLVDGSTRIDRLENKGDELIYHLTLVKLTDRGDITPSQLRRSVQRDFVRRMCTTPETAYLLSKNVKVRLEYKDANGEKLLTLPIAAADCAGVR